MRCRECYVVFPVPPMPERIPMLHKRARSKEPQTGTPVKLHHMEDFPPALRKAVGTPTDVVFERDDASEAPTRPSIPAMTREEAERQAFDLDQFGEPRSVTGAKLLRIRDLPEPD